MLQFWPTLRGKLFPAMNFLFCSMLSFWKKQRFFAKAKLKCTIWARNINHWSWDIYCQQTKKRAESRSNVLFLYLDDQIIVKHKPLNLWQIRTVLISTELNQDISYGTYCAYRGYGIAETWDRALFFFKIFSFQHFLLVLFSLMYLFFNHSIHFLPGITGFSRKVSLKTAISSSHV